jgi:hypothetical protein
MVVFQPRASTDRQLLASLIATHADRGLDGAGEHAAVELGLELIASLGGQLPRRPSFAAEPDSTLRPSRTYAA